MKYSKILVTVASALMTSFALSATPEQEKTFVDSYRKALETNDTKTLQSFLLSKGAAPEALEAYKMMQQVDTGAKIVSVELVKLEAEEVARHSESMPGPGGVNFKLPVKPFKKLVIKTETSDANGSSTSSSSVPVAEKDGKLVIPVPVVAR